MKRAAGFLLVLFLLTGCSGQPKELDRAVKLRSAIQQASEVSFVTDVAADYEDKTQTFSLQCSMDSKGDVRFTVMEPESISGISGQLSNDEGKLLFEDTALSFPLLADGQLSPVSAPWILMKTLRSGYITSACTEGDEIHLTVDDSYQEDALQLDIWLNSENMPVQADILFDGRRILTMNVKSFRIL